MSASPTAVNHTTQDQPFPDYFKAIHKAGYLGIRRLDVTKGTWTSGGTPQYLIREIIGKANESSQGKSQSKSNDTEGIYKPITLNNYKWRPQDHEGFDIRTFLKNKRSSTNPEDSQSTDASMYKEKTNTYLMFLFKDEEIYAVGTRDAHIAVGKYTDDDWPMKFCRFLLHPERLKESTSLSLFSTISKRVETYRRHYRIELLRGRDYVYTQLRLPFHPETKTRQLEVFPGQNQNTSRVDIDVEVGGGRVVIHSKIQATEYPKILSRILEDMNSSLPEKRARQFDVLDYIKEVKNNIEIEKLKKCILDSLFNCMKWQEQAPFNLHYVEDFSVSNNEKLHIFIEDKEKYETSPDDLNLRNLMAILSEFKEKDASHFKKVKIQIDGMPKKLLLDCIEGEISTPDGAYFKIGKCFYKLSGDYISIVRTDFRRSLNELLLPQSDPGFLNREWTNNKSQCQLTQTLIKKACNLPNEDSNKIFSALKKQTVSYVSQELDLWKPMLFTLKGEILKSNDVSNYKSSIERVLRSKNPLSLEALTKELEVPKTTAKKVWIELTKSRHVLKKESSNFYVLNPFSENEKINPLLEDLCRRYYNNISEGQYNQSYLNDPNTLVGDCVITSSGIELFDLVRWTKDTTYVYHVKEGFDLLVRDAINQLLNSVDVISEARYSHTKMNDLDDWYQKATNPTGKEVSSYRTQLKTIVAKMGLKAFKELFTKKKLVFVYAVLDSQSQENSLLEETKLKNEFSPDDLEKVVKSRTNIPAVAQEIFKELQRLSYLNNRGQLTSTFYSATKEKFKKEAFSSSLNLTTSNKGDIYDILAGQASRYKSMIARLTIQRAVRYMEGRSNFEFKICQIKRRTYQKGSIPITSSPVNLNNLPRLEPPLFLDDKGNKFIRIRTTQGDGSCALHALMSNSKDSNHHVFNVGDESSGEPIWKRAKIDFLEKLSESYERLQSTTDERLQHIDQEAQTLARESIHDLLKGEMRSKYNQALADAEKRKEENAKELDKLYETVLDQMEDSFKMLEVIRSKDDSSIENWGQFIEMLLNNPQKRIQLFTQSLPRIQNFLNTFMGQSNPSKRQEVQDEIYKEFLKYLKGYLVLFPELNSTNIKKTISKYNDQKKRSNLFYKESEDIQEMLMHHSGYQTHKTEKVRAQMLLDRASDDFYDDKDTRQWYRKKVLEQSYQLSDHELKLAALLYKRKVLLFIKGQKHPREINASAPGDWIAILHEGTQEHGHYSRLDPVET